jgi:hypothetical protein
MVECIAKGLIAKVSGVQDDSETFHFFEELTPQRSEWAGVIGAMSTATRSIMGQADGAKAGSVGLFEMSR